MRLFRPPKPCPTTSLISHPTQGEFKGVRTFAQQVKHVAAVNYMMGGAILSEKPPVDLGGENGPDKYHLEGRTGEISERLVCVSAQGGQQH